MTNRAEFQLTEQELQALFDSTNAVDPELLDLVDAIVKESVISTEEDSDIFLSPEEIAHLDDLIADLENGNFLI